MLSKAKNEYLTRVGPETPMGKLLRAYWLPLLYSHELAENDGAPVRIQLLGEKLVAFRDSSGRVGLLDHHCPHRLASLFYGRNENNGLRCLYHGWQFDVQGHCIDMPNVADGCAARHKVKARAYPCREANGIIWTYMGPGAPPPLPGMGWATVPAGQKTRLKYMRHCNWVQAMEGDFDSSHLSFLHRPLEKDSRARDFAKKPGGDGLRGLVALDGAPELEIADTRLGVMYAARRDAADEKRYWRVTQFQMPFYTSIPAYNGLNRMKIWVPMDDEHTMVWEANWSRDAALGVEQRKGVKARVPASGMLPDSDDWFGRGRFAAGADNDYRIDRARQKDSNFSGMEDSPPIQDAAMQESMGPIVDRSREHLMASDAAIIRLRKCLFRAAEALGARKTVPPGVKYPDLYRSHGDQLLLPQSGDWKDGYERLMREQYEGL